MGTRCLVHPKDHQCDYNPSDHAGQQMSENLPCFLNPLLNLKKEKTWQENCNKAKL